MKMVKSWKKAVAYVFIMGCCISSPAMVLESQASGQIKIEGNKATGYEGNDIGVYLNVPSGVQTIGSAAFQWKSFVGASLPDTVTVIEEYGFLYCIMMEEIRLSPNITSIGDGAFDGCESLKRITIPQKVTEIRYGAFKGCMSLTEVVIPSGVKEIGTCAFYGCTSLKTIRIPESVTFIGEEAFYNCSNLTIEGYHGSSAESYAKQYGIPFRSLGTATAQYLPVDPSTRIGWQYVDGKWYMYGEMQIMLRNKWTIDNGMMYWLGDDGAMYVNRWLYTEGNWYYLGSSGAMLKGWQLINGVWYYLDPGNGAMYANTYTPDGYYVNENGAWV